MNTRLEDDLARTLGAAATAAPEPAVDFAAGVARRRRHNRRARIADVTTVAVVVAGLVAGLVAVAALRVDVEKRLEVASFAPIDLRAVRHVTEVWPEAVTDAVSDLPDGRVGFSVGRLDDHRYVIVPTNAGPPRHHPVVYDTSTREVQELFDNPPDSFSRTWDQVVVTRDTIVIVLRDLDWVVGEVWTAPRAGGQAQRRAVFQKDGWRQRVRAWETGGRLYASVTESQLRQPLPAKDPSTTYRITDDGRTEKIVDGFRLSEQAPWATIDLPRPGPGPLPVPTFLNVVTGERRTPRTPDGVTLAGCSALACIGTVGDDLVSYRLDGSRRLRATGLPGTQRHVSAVFDPTGRFAQIEVLEHAPDVPAVRSYLLWDLAKNTIGRLDVVSVGLGLTWGWDELATPGKVFDLTRVR